MRGSKLAKAIEESEDFEGRLLERYSFDDSLRLSKKDFMDWVDSPSKGRNASALLQEFES